MARYFVDKNNGTLLYSRVRLFVHEAKRKVRIFSVSCRSAMNFVRESLFAGAMRNSGSVWRSAFATTNSEGRDAGTNGSQPGAEGVPNQLGSSDSEILEQPLGDNAGLDEGMIGALFAFDTVSVIVRLAMKILIAIAGAQRNHVLHPEMVGE